MKRFIISVLIVLALLSTEFFITKNELNVHVYDVLGWEYHRQLDITKSDKYGRLEKIWYYFDRRFDGEELGVTITTYGSERIFTIEVSSQEALTYDELVYIFDFQDDFEEHAEDYFKDNVYTTLILSAPKFRLLRADEITMEFSMYDIDYLKWREHIDIVSNLYYEYKELGAFTFDISLSFKKKNATVERFEIILNDTVDVTLRHTRPDIFIPEEQVVAYITSAFETEVVEFTVVEYK